MIAYKKLANVPDNATFDDLIKIITDAVAEYQAPFVTVREYKNACNQFKKFAENRSSSIFTAELYDSYIQQLAKDFEAHKICFGYYRFLKRVARIISHLALTGELDFSYAHTIGQKYPVNEECSALIDSVFEKEKITEKQKKDLAAPMRHMLWYGYEHGYTLETLNDEIIMQYLIDEVPVTNGGSTGRTLRCVKYLTSYMREHGISNIMYHYENLTLKRDFVKIIPAFSEEEINSIRDVVDVTTNIGKRDLAIILLGYGYGLRGIDIVNLTKYNIDWKNHLLKFSQNKTEKSVVLPLNGETMNAIADYILEARPECESDRIFLTVTAPFRPLSGHFANMIDHYCNKAHVEKIPLRAFHSLRRGFETVLAEKGTPIESNVINIKTSSQTA